MKGTALILFCAIALALGDEEIELLPNGCPTNFTIHMTLPHDTYCNRFDNCLAGERVVQDCSKGLVFNPEEGVCDWPYNVECGGKGIYVPDSDDTEEEVVNPGGNTDPSAAPKICAKEESEGVLVAHENCEKYYVCNGGVPVEMECNPGLLYNSDHGICDWYYNVECGGRIVPSFAQMKRAVLNIK